MAEFDSNDRETISAILERARLEVASLQLKDHTPGRFPFTYHHDLVGTRMRTHEVGYLSRSDVAGMLSEWAQESQSPEVYAWTAIKGALEYMVETGTLEAMPEGLAKEADEYLAGINFSLEDYIKEKFTPQPTPMAGMR